MKKIYQSTLFTLALMLFMVSLTTPVFAFENRSTQIQRFEDGSYVVIATDTDQSQDIVTFATGKQITSGTKSYSYYNGSDELLLVFRVHGTFEYNGVTASAIGANYSYDIYGGNWSFVDGSATYSGATATATGKFKRFLVPSSTTVTLTCSANGVLS